MSEFSFGALTLMAFPGAIIAVSAIAPFSLPDRMTRLGRHLSSNGRRFGFSAVEVSAFNLPYEENVLFVCLQNSVCSQMAEAFVHQVAPEHFAAHSAGLLPGPVDPVAVAAMREIGLDISASRPKWIYDFLAMPMNFDFIITVCDASAERCPAFHGGGIRLHWSFPDQREHYEDFEKRLTQFRKLRDAIQAKVGAWCAQTTGTATHSHPIGRPPDSAWPLNPK